MYSLQPNGLNRILPALEDIDLNGIQFRSRKTSVNKGNRAFNNNKQKNEKRGRKQEYRNVKRELDITKADTRGQMNIIKSGKYDNSHPDKLQIPIENALNEGEEKRDTR